MKWNGVIENEMQWKEIKWDAIKDAINAIKESKVEPSGTRWSEIQRKRWNGVRLYEMDMVESMKVKQNVVKSNWVEHNKRKCFEME